jgi:hypothetical protein
VSGGTATSGQQVPQAIVADFQPGFGFDPDAVAERCSPGQASGGACPEASRIGSGQAVVTASGPFLAPGGQDFTATIDLFLAPPVQTGDLAGVVLQVSVPNMGRRSLTGRILRLPPGPFGTELRFEGLDQAGQAPPGYSATLKQLDVTVGAHRSVTTTRKVRRRVRTRHGRRRTRTRTVRHTVAHDLITNPATCDGAWEGRLTVHYSDHDDTQDLSTPCTA